MAIYYDSKELVKDTPLLLLNGFHNNEKVKIYVKLECQNPAGGIKDRIGIHIVNQLFKVGQLKKGMTLIEATAGNTGLGLAFALVNSGVNLMFVIPYKFSIEKQQLLRALGATIVNTDALKGMEGAIEEAKRLRELIPNSLSVYQFSNPENPNAHYLTTGPEIYKDLDGNINYFVSGAGSGGTFSGIMRYFKERNSRIKGILADPIGSIIGGGEHSDYRIEGIGNGFIPDTMNVKYIDEVIKVTDHEAYDMVREIAIKTGLFVGSSSGANLTAAIKLANKIESGNIVTVFFDRGERYLSQNIYTKE
ncbi:MAG: PLP-dependent cysteine synthase family protein [Erysipelotrichaceae bacterium]